METTVILLSIALVVAFVVIAYQRYVISDEQDFSHKKDEEIEKLRDDINYTIKALEENKKIRAKLASDVFDFKKKCDVKQKENQELQVKIDELNSKYRSAATKAGLYEKKLKDVLDKLEAKINETDKSSKKKVEQK